MAELRVVESLACEAARREHDLAVAGNSVPLELRDNAAGMRILPQLPDRPVYGFNKGLRPLRRALGTSHCDVMHILDGNPRPLNCRHVARIDSITEAIASS
jgi:hypothetical protein